MSVSALSHNVPSTAAGIAATAITKGQKLGSHGNGSLNYNVVVKAVPFDVLNNLVKAKTGGRAEIDPAARLPDPTNPTHLSNRCAVSIIFGSEVVADMPPYAPDQAVSDLVVQCPGVRLTKGPLLVPDAQDLNAPWVPQQTGFAYTLVAYTSSQRGVQAGRDLGYPKQLAQFSNSGVESLQGGTMTIHNGGREIFSATSGSLRSPSAMETAIWGPAFDHLPPTVDMQWVGPSKVSRRNLNETLGMRDHVNLKLGAHLVPGLDLANAPTLVNATLNGDWEFSHGSIQKV